MLGQLLLARRMDLGLSQEMIAKKVGVLRSTVSRWENNKIKGAIPIPTIHKISLAYDLSKTDIIAALPDEQKEDLIKILNYPKRK